MKKLTACCIFLLILGIFSFGYTQETTRVASVIEITGTVEVQPVNGAWRAAETGMTLYEGDLIRTQAESRAILNLDGEAQTATLELKANSQLKLSQLKKDEAEQTQNTLLDLSLGEVLIHAQKLHSEKSKFEVKTPTSIVGVRGTTFSVAVEAVE
ncbi:MAG: FecR family protein [Candidatus Omnitrophota bacterium]